MTITRCRRALGLTACLALLFLATSESRAWENGVALTPPMGWNSWNKFGCNVSEDLIKSMADGMVASGMKDAGYQYVVIDDCWQVSRDADGNIVPDAQRFPSGMKGARRLHPLEGIEIWNLLRRRRKNVRETTGQHGTRISGRAGICEVGRRLFEIRLVQHRKAQCGGSILDDARRIKGERADNSFSACVNGEQQNRGCGPRTSGTSGAPRETSRISGPA